MEILDYVGDDDSDDDTKVEINDDGSFQKMSLVAPPEEEEPPKPVRKKQNNSLSLSNPLGSSSGSVISLLDSDSDNELQVSDEEPNEPEPFTRPLSRSCPIIRLSDSDSDDD